MIPIAHPLLGVEEQEAVLRVLTSTQLAQGEHVAAFERRFAEVCHVREAVAVSSGTVALHDEPSKGTPRFQQGAISSIHIPLLDLRAQNQTIKHEVMASFEDVLEHIQLFLGPQCQAFEQEFATYCGGCQDGVGFSNGTHVLALALHACGIGDGDEVITVANTFIATFEAIALVGAKPIFVDVDPDTYAIDWRQLDRVLTPRTRAIITVHLHGQPVDMQPVMDFARAHGLRVIEDASQAHGATYRGQRVGSLGDIGCFSLYYRKNLGAYGEAGICVTNDAALAGNLRMLRDHGSHVRYRHEVLG